MKILITDENRAMINKAFDDIHSGKESIHLADFDDVMHAVKIAQNKASDILKKHCKHFRYYYSLNQKKANSYKYSYSADAFIIEWTSKGWNLIAVQRTMFFPNQKDQSKFYWNLKSEDKLIVESEVKDHLLQQFLK